MLELVGLEPRPDLHSDGVSLVPLLSGGSIADRSLYWQREMNAQMPTPNPDYDPVEAAGARQKRIPRNKRQG